MVFSMGLEPIIARLKVWCINQLCYKNMELEVCFRVELNYLDYKSSASPSMLTDLKSNIDYIL